MTKNFVMSYFREMCEAGAAPGTVSTAKSSLVKILSFGFDIDLLDAHFASASKTCAVMNPSKRPTEISWSLNKVLLYAASIDNETASYQQLLWKTLFLLNMASGP